MLDEAEAGRFYGLEEIFFSCMSSNTGGYGANLICKMVFVILYKRQ